MTDNLEEGIIDYEKDFTTAVNYLRDLDEITPSDLDNICKSLKAMWETINESQLFRGERAGTSDEFLSPPSLKSYRESLNKNELWELQKKLFNFFENDGITNVDKEKVIEITLVIQDIRIELYGYHVAAIRELQSLRYKMTPSWFLNEG